MFNTSQMLEIPVSSDGFAGTSPLSAPEACAILASLLHARRHVMKKERRHCVHHISLASLET